MRPFERGLRRTKRPVGPVVSEAAVTRAPVPVAELPGHSRRIGLFHEMMRADGRTRPF